MRLRLLPRRPRLRVLSLLVVLAVIAAALVLSFGSPALPGFEIERAILPQLDEARTAEVTKTLGPVAGMNLFSVSTEDLERRLLGIAWVKRAQVHRRFPDALEIVLVERTPLARVRDGHGRTWLLGDDGRVVARASREDVGLILFRPAGVGDLDVGASLPWSLSTIVPLAERLNDLGEGPTALEVARVELTEDEEAVLVLQDATEIRLGSVAHLEDKLMVAGEIIKEYSSQGRHLAYVDVYFPDRPVAREKAP